ncbi:MAG: NAD(P)H-hydrate dehydratase [Ignavibacteriaceae bacterium]
MIPLYSTSQIRKIDDYAIAKLGIPGIVLMENASREIFEIANWKIAELNSTKIGFVCGSGNNGGDGFAVARHFANEGYKVNVIYTGSEKEMTGDCKTNFSILKKIAANNKNIIIIKYRSPSSLNSIKSCNVLCDALLGSGVKGKLREPYFSIVKIINKIKAYKIAIDIPTGLDSDKGFAEESFFADLTITLGEFKKGLFFGFGYTCSGEVEKGSIGISTDYFQQFTPMEYLIEPEDALNGLPVKRKNLHKYSAGKVLTLAGSGALPGAAVLTAKSVLKIGAGASILCFPKSVRNLIHKKLGEVVVHAYNDNNKEFLSEENVSELDEKIRWADVIAIGPGLGREMGTIEAVIKLLEKYHSKKMVIDADAVFALGRGKYRRLNLTNKILTPHLGEFANLIGIKTEELKKDLLKHGKNFTKRTGAYLVLKSAPTIIFNPAGEAFINTTGNPSLAKFGTGDVLTGIIGGLLSQQKDIEAAIISSVYLHSLTADILIRKRTEYDILASDLINNLPRSIKFLSKSIV